MTDIHQLLHSSKTVEWYTPARYIEAARAVMGGIDLDPASCEQANQIIQAGHYFTEDDNGLIRDWTTDGQPARVWLNPPYGRINGKSGQELFSKKMIAEYRAGHITAGIMLVNAATDCKWFSPLWSFPICFTDHRIKFISPTNGKAKQPTHGSAFIYFGPDPALFAATFRRFGMIVRSAAL